MKDKRYIISGAGSGIGRAIALRLSSEGAGIILMDEIRINCKTH